MERCARFGRGDGTGVPRCAQDDGKNLKGLGRATARTNNDDGEKQIPFGDDNQRDKSNGNGEYRGLSTARRTMRLSAASVERTCFPLLCSGESLG
jgi:hypothetical protein